MAKKRKHKAKRAGSHKRRRRSSKGGKNILGARSFLGVKLTLPILGKVL